MNKNSQMLNLKHAIIKILYVFNPILLTDVFTADLQWSNLTIVISKNDFT